MTGWRTRPPGIGCCMHHQGLHLEPSDPRDGNGQGEQQPCPNGHHPGQGVLGTRAVCSLEDKKKTQPPDLQKSSCVWSGVSRYPLCSVLGMLRLDPAPCFGPIVWEGQENEPGSVQWAGGTEAAAFGQQRERRGAPAAAVGRGIAKEMELNFLAVAEGRWEASGAGWAAAPPRRCQGCYRSVGVLPAAAQVLLGPGWGTFASATLTGRSGGQAAATIKSEQQFRPCSSTLPL